MVIQKWLNFITGQNLRLNFWTALLGAAMSQAGKSGGGGGGGGDAGNPQALMAKDQQNLAQNAQMDLITKQPSPMPQTNGLQMPTGQNYAPVGVQPKPVEQSGFAQFLQQQSQNYQQGGLFGMLAQLMGGNKNG